MCFAVMNHVQDNQRKSARKLVQTTFKIFKKELFQKIQKILNYSKKIEFEIIKYDLSFDNVAFKEKMKLHLKWLHAIGISQATQET